MRKWIANSVACIAAALLLGRALAQAPGGAAQVVELAAGQGRQADNHSVVIYRFIRGTTSMVSSRNLALPRDDPDPSVSRSISEALPGMKVGGRRRVTTPPIAGRPSVFELELLDVAATEAELKPRIEYMNAAEKAPQGPDPGTFFKGCTVKRGDPGQSNDQIAGSCAGHAFSGEGLSIPAPCQANFSAGSNIWTVYNCNMDGRLVYSAHFRTDIGKLADVRYMSTAATAGVTRPDLLGPGTGPGPELHPLQPLGASTAPPAAAPAATNTEADKQYCNAQVQKHLQQGGIPSGVGYVFNNCMNEKRAIANGKLRQAEQDARAAEQEQQQLQAHLRDASVVCPSGAQTPTAAAATGATMYGLAVNAPVPCLRFCGDEPKGQKGRLCVDDQPLRNTAWGTVRFAVNPNDDVFEFLDILGTGRPQVELAGGRIVGMDFGNGIYGPDQWLAVLSKKFGRYHALDGSYAWDGPGYSARLVAGTSTSYAPVGQVDLEHPFGEGIEGEDHDVGHFSIYVPEVRARKEAYEAAEALKNRKESF